MKKHTFDTVINSNLKKFINLPINEIEYVDNFYQNPPINMEDYISWSVASMECFGMRYYSFWYSPNEKDFQGVMDAIAMAYIAQIMYFFDEEKKFHQNLVDGVPLFLAILSFGKEREIDLMFDAIIGLIREDIKKEYTIYHQNKTLQEAFLLYDLYTNSKKHDVWQPYITKSLAPEYQRLMDVILSDNEEDVNDALAEMMKYHRRRAHIESFVTNEFYPTEWRVFPIEIIALIRYRYLQGKSIDFINHEVLSKFIPYLKQTEYHLSPVIEKAKNDIYKLLSID